MAAEIHETECQERAVVLVQRVLCRVGARVGQRGLDVGYLG